MSTQAKKTESYLSYLTLFSLLNWHIEQCLSFFEPLNQTHHQLGIHEANEVSLLWEVLRFHFSSSHLTNTLILSTSNHRKTSYIVNVSRGPLVDTEALAKALENDEIAGAGLDVLENEPNIPLSHPLLSESIQDKVLLLPHIGSGTTETRQAMADLACQNALGALGVDGLEMVQEKKLWFGLVLQSGSDEDLGKKVRLEFERRWRF